MIGSWSLNAHRNGLSNFCSVSHAARLAVAAGIVRRRRHEQRELARPFLVRVVGERRVVGGDRGVVELGAAAALHDAADVEVGRLLAVLLPREEGLARIAVAGRQERVRGHDPSEAVRVLGDQPEPDRVRPSPGRRA